VRKRKTKTRKKTFLKRKKRRLNNNIKEDDIK
jgi:hypothetical protein